MKTKELLPPFLVEGITPYLEEATPYLFSRMLIPIYLELDLKVKGTVFVCTQVHTDGHGDYLALLKAGWALKKWHPQLNIELVFTYARPLPEVDPQGLILHAFHEHPDRPILEPILEGRPSPEVSAESIMAEALYERMKNALAIVHVALALNTFDNPLLAPHSLYFSEAGNFQGYGNSLKYNWYSQGLGPLEEGIFLDYPAFPRHDIPGRFLAYFSRNEHQITTFKNLATLLSHNSPFEIMTPTKPLPFNDFQKIIAESNALVGCTGDGSLSECLALGKIPYYEIRPHKTKTLEGLFHLCRFLKLKGPAEYFIAQSKVDQDMSAELYQILTRKNFGAEWKKLITYIHTYCRLEESLTARARRVILKTAPLEESLSKDILAGKETFNTAFKKAKKELLGIAHKSTGKI